MSFASGDADTNIRATLAPEYGNGWKDEYVLAATHSSRWPGAAYRLWQASSGERG
jgi:hypothetical protein